MSYNEMSYSNSIENKSDTISDSSKEYKDAKHIDKYEKNSIYS